MAERSGRRGRARAAPPATALVLRSPRDLVVTEIERPVVAPDTGVLRVEACGLCGTDHEQFTGALHPGWPFVPGHEVVGVVEEIGPDAARRWEVAEGDRVAVEVFLACGVCGPCGAGEIRVTRTSVGRARLTRRTSISSGHAATSRCATCPARPAGRWRRS